MKKLSVGCDCVRRVMNDERQRKRALRNDSGVIVALFREETKEKNERNFHWADFNGNFIWELN